MEHYIQVSEKSFFVYLTFLAVWIFLYLREGIARQRLEARYRRLKKEHDALLRAHEGLGAVPADHHLERVMDVRVTKRRRFSLSRSVHFWVIVLMFVVVAFFLFSLWYNTKGGHL